ncbi:ABC transporter permease (plasmid) [Martelella lutilitoris]|uniref:Autoinducer 2 import system permease protein LsrC n=2 Tax=Martelella lutilitoris TaxID=2583532 RepID=A0A7T7HPX9_9HYPH|nr:ABC transporter permease [Martelella lutilitoris]QQM33157.1 ABC transporter permease [Martelella lutilitoris]QRX65399.1 ABC transporter permease [Dysgonomonadaceae bacterium zrk40]
MSAALAGGRIRRLTPVLLPLLILVMLVGLVFVLRPNTMSYMGLNLLLKLSVPLIFAALSQMLIISQGDLDLSTGAYVGFVTCISAVYLADQPILGWSILIGSVLLYGLVGLVTWLRRLPSIVVTLGMSFVWLGLALFILPSPGGQAPDWLVALPRLRPAFMPFPIWTAIVCVIVLEFGLMRSSAGVVLRGAGGNPQAMVRAGWSVAGLRAIAYLLAGVCAMISGLLLSGLTTSGAPNIAPSYTLLSIASVILGGGAFVGGIVSPFGAVVGAITLTLVSSVLTFLHVPSVWQIGAQGGLLILVLLLRGLLKGDDQ